MASHRAPENKPIMAFTSRGGFVQRFPLPVIALLLLYMLIDSIIQNDTLEILRFAVFLGLALYMGFTFLFSKIEVFDNGKIAFSRLWFKQTVCRSDIVSYTKKKGFILTNGKRVRHFFPRFNYYPQNEYKHWLAANFRDIK